MKHNYPRLMLAAPASGSGKTTLTIGLLQTLLNRGLKPAAFKCGPDYIDPMFHREVLGLAGYNLDLFFTPPHIVRGLLAQGMQKADVALIEGVMGYYDGAAGTTEGSTWHLACETETPCVLALKPGGAALSAVATVKGFCTFRPETRIAGVLLNQCSEQTAGMLAKEIERECGLPVYGYLPKMPELKLHSRHLGLVTPNEIGNLRKMCNELALQIEKTVDVDALLELARSAPGLQDELPLTEKIAPPVCIAVAQDNAFCFYYRENLELLQSMGAALVFFSPLEDAQLPDNIGGLYLGGGYPELYAETLSNNSSMKKNILRAVSAGMPTIAECGGFLYLQKTLEDENGLAHSMVGALPGKASNRKKLDRFGYVCLEAQADTMLCCKGDVLHGHEFHYWDSTQCGDNFFAQKPHTGKGWSCVHANENLYAGFPHLYFWSNPAAAMKFVKAASAHQNNAPPV